ncbi:17767_t:CDS:2, partial [Racocetra fulgida]
MNQQQIQRQEAVTAYDRQVTHEIFHDTMEFLEKYIEIAGYYPDWHARRQFPNNEVKRTIDGPEDAEECFSIVLLGLKNTIKHKPPFIQEEIKQEFYRWISSTGINENNSPERLQHILFGFHEILEGRSEKFDKDLKNSKQTLDHNSPEYAKELTTFFAAFQEPLQNQRDIAESLEGKKHDEINIENKFNGTVEQGQGILEKMANLVRSLPENFNFFQQEDQKEINANGQPSKNEPAENDDHMITDNANGEPPKDKPAENGDGMVTDNANGEPPQDKPAEN